MRLGARNYLPNVALILMTFSAPPGQAAPLEVESETLIQPVAVPLPADVLFIPVRIGAGDGQTAVGEKLIYSNTLGTFAVNFPTNQPVSDDIAITAANGCALTRYKFKVLGKVLPTGATGPYTVTYGLYSNCPLAVGTNAATRDLVKIPGTDGAITFDDDAPREIEHVVNPGTPVSIPTNFYLSIRFDRSNCGTVVGTPALVGFSGDMWDYPGFPCNGYLGGFPDLPHASMWAEFYGDQTCKDAYLGYKSAKASGPTAMLGAQIQGVDDVRLIVHDCRMISYEVTVRGIGFYTFDLRRGCDGSVIAGTEKTFMVSAATTPQLQVARFNFDPPIPIPSGVFLGFKVSSNVAGSVIAGIAPTVGTSNDYFSTVAPEGCVPYQGPQGVYGAINLAIVCDGVAPVGACCDSFLRHCQGGDEEGARCTCDRKCVGGWERTLCCSVDSDCTAGTCEEACPGGGSCEAVCRQVPQINCFHRVPFQWAPWIEAAACEPDPFPHACGTAACCKPDDTCENLTQSQCEAVEPLDRPRLWQLGQFCDELEQECMFNACLTRDGGDCLRVRPGEVGCDDPFCCTDVCDFDSWCCQVEWDELCLRWADTMCAGRAPSNDQCIPGFPVNGLTGAFDIPVPGVLFGTNSYATTPFDVSEICCLNEPGICVGGLQSGEPCLTNEHCWGGICTKSNQTPGYPGFGSVWHRFVATHSTARITTCGSKGVDPRFTDSAIQVLAAQDTTSLVTECDSLTPIGCNDGAGVAVCPDDPGNAELCVGGLVPGAPYYVLLASKVTQTQGLYRLEITSPCEPALTVAGDFCVGAAAISDGATPFDLQSATFDCPAEGCTPTAQNDIWFDYVATCTGEAEFSTCGSGNPDTNLVVYESAGSTCSKCPPNVEPIGCSADVQTDGCGNASRVRTNVILGRCHKIRLADVEGFTVAGNLTITCTSGDCQPNGIPDDQDISNCAAEDFSCTDCNTNGVPDSCDIRDNAELDENFNGRIDECEACPPMLLALRDLPNRVVDARRPTQPDDPLGLLVGINSVVLSGNVGGADLACWTLCETNLNSGLHPPYPPELATNGVFSLQYADHEYTVGFKRAITPGETTILSYTDDLRKVTSFRFTAHPGNVNGDLSTGPADLLALIDMLNGVAESAWGFFSTDCDHSSVSGPADILCVIDLLNAGWNGTSRPSNVAQCP